MKRWCARPVLSGRRLPGRNVELRALKALCREVNQAAEVALGQRAEVRPQAPACSYEEGGAGA